VEVGKRTPNEKNKIELKNCIKVATVFCMFNDYEQQYVWY
jgi:hypothetical protein